MDRGYALNIRSRLLLLIFAVVAPVVVLAAVATVALWQQQRAAFEQTILERVRALRLALDTELWGTQRVLLSLSESADLDTPERLASFTKRFPRLLANYRTWSTIGLRSEAGPMLASASQESVSEDLVVDDATFAKVLETRAPFISNLTPSAGGQLLMTYVAVPVIRQGQPVGVLFAGIEHRSWLDFLRSYPITERATLTLNDRDSVLIARTLNDERWAGKRSNAQFWNRTIGNDEGAFRNEGVDGQRFYTSFSRSSLSHWVLGTGVPQDDVESALKGTTAAIVAGVVVAALTALFFAWWLGGQISGTLQALQRTATTMGDSIADTSISTPLAIEEAETVRRTLNTSAEKLRQRDAALQEAFGREVALRAETERVSSAKDEFLAMLSHELRNPLSAITSAATLLGMPQVTVDQATRAREIINRQVENLAEMINDLMDVARLNAGKIALKRRRMNLAQTVRHVLDGFVDSGRCSHLKMSVALADTWVDGDETRLEQVIANLLDNACKYTARSGEVSVTLESVGGMAQLTVSDNGIGIAKELLPLVFDLFTQGKRSLDRAQGGLGLGLTVVRRLVDLHGGTIEARSEGAARGSMFILRLPEVPAGAGSARDLTTSTTVRPLRVVVVEDRSDNREMLRSILQSRGHEVVAFDDGPGGVDFMTKHDCDLGLIDIGLPGFDGMEVARRVRKTAGRNPVLIALTGYGSNEARDSALAAGFDAFLVKPASLEAIERILAEHFAVR